VIAVETVRECHTNLLQAASTLKGKGSMQTIKLL
jgi:hypothetical protein